MWHLNGIIVIKCNGNLFKMEKNGNLIVSDFFIDSNYEDYIGVNLNRITKTITKPYNNSLFQLNQYQLWNFFNF